MNWTIVVCGVIKKDDKFLCCQRSKKMSLPLQWEFPGGKVELGETTELALTREVKEELGVEIAKATPLIEIRHDYQDKSVLLDVWSTRYFEGEPKGLEGQTIKWCPIEALTDFDFPAANQTIIEAIQATEF